MDIVVTGATGYVGARIVHDLLENGHRVTGVVRSKERLSALDPRVKPVVGDLGAPAAIIDAASPADAVIHSGFAGHGVGWAEAVAIEEAFLDALCGRLQGSGKTIILSNGTIFLGDSGMARLDETAEVDPDHPAAIRAQVMEQIRARFGTGLSTIELRLASFVYGHGGSVFLPILLEAAKRLGTSIYVGDGLTRTSAVHVDAAAAAYRMALEKGAAGAVYHIASDEDPRIKDIAEAIATASGGACQAESVTLDQARDRADPFTLMFLTTNNRLSAEKARRELQWVPAGFAPLLWDVAHGSYAEKTRGWD